MAAHFRPLYLRTIFDHSTLSLLYPVVIGGGIVYDSIEEDEYIETINKLGANIRCISQAEG